MVDADPIASKQQKCIDAVKKAYAVSDAFYDVVNAEIIGDDRETILNLLTEARDLAIECGCIDLVEKADALRKQVAHKPDTQPEDGSKLKSLQEKVEDLKQTAKECLKPPDQARPPP